MRSVKSTAIVDIKSHVLRLLEHVRWTMGNVNVKVAGLQLAVTRTSSVFFEVRHCLFAVIFPLTGTETENAHYGKDWNSN